MSLFVYALLSNSLPDSYGFLIESKTLCPFVIIIYIQMKKPDSQHRIIVRISLFTTRYKKPTLCTLPNVPSPISLTSSQISLGSTSLITFELSFFFSFFEKNGNTFLKNTDMARNKIGDVF